MASCKTLFPKPMVSSMNSTLRSRKVSSRSYVSLSYKSINSSEELLFTNPSSEPPENNPTQDDIARRLMKMERRGIDNADIQEQEHRTGQTWFPYLDRLKCQDGTCLTSGEIVETLELHIKCSRMEKFRTVARNRSYSLSLVVEGVNLANFINVSATLRSAKALGFQSVHVVSCDGSKSSKECREKSGVSMGAEGWLDIELWDSIEECFKAPNHVAIELPLPLLD